MVAIKGDCAGLDTLVTVIVALLARVIVYPPPVHPSAHSKLGEADPTWFVLYAGVLFVIQP